MNRFFSRYFFSPGEKARYAIPDGARVEILHPAGPLHYLVKTIPDQHEQMAKAVDLLPESEWLEKFGPKIQVYCSGCKKLVNEEDTEFIGISEDIQGADLLTFKCKKCGQQSTSRRLG